MVNERAEGKFQRRCGDTLRRARWVSSSGSRSSKLLCELPTPPEESSKHVLESTGTGVPASPGVFLPEQFPRDVSTAATAAPSVLSGYVRGKGIPSPAIRRLTACVIAGCVGHASVHCDSGPRAWGPGERARDVCFTGSGLNIISTRRPTLHRSTSSNSPGQSC